MGRFDGKTEKATPRRRRDARRKGQVARSAEVGIALSLVGMVAAVQVLRHGAGALGDQASVLFSLAPTEGVPTGVVVSTTVGALLATIVPVAIIAVIAALVAGVGQTGGKLSPEALRPKLSNLSPKKGLQRLKPSTAGWELLRTSVKLGALAVLLWGPITGVGEALMGSRDLGSGLERIMSQVLGVLWRATLLAMVLAMADYAWNRRKHERELRMSKQDVKQEHKDSEGDPLVKGQRRRRAQEMSRNRMLRDVTTADVVVTNPTHLAIALRYDADDPAPRVVARGADHLAARIRQLARRHGVLVTEDKPLARSLYGTCKVGQHVPVALYEAVAVVLALAYRRRGRQVA